MLNFRIFWSIIYFVVFGFVMGGEVFALHSKYQQELVGLHNAERNAVGVPSLEWSAILASKAQRWVNYLAKDNRCELVHSQSEAGENIFWASARRWSNGSIEPQFITPKVVVDSWASEKAHYDFVENKCEIGEVCGHYTQLIWGSTTRLGCGAQYCKDQSQIWVCQYEPAGNYIGQRPL